MSDEPVRPSPPRAVRERAAAWLAWFGLGRLVTAALSVIVVAAGAWWLLRTPVPSTEASLPLASTTTTSVAASVAGAVVTTGASRPDAAAASVPTVLHVHVAGAVADPGVHELAPGSRVVDAVASAGGPTADADVDALNLAAPLADGERIRVPRTGETVVTDPPPAPSTAGPPPGPVDLNVATVAQLDTLPGIGPTTAAAIVSHRDEHGPFVTVDDLLDVRGIGPAKLDLIRGLVTT
jgi:competence protein ComEA